MKRQHHDFAFIMLLTISILLCSSCAKDTVPDTTDLIPGTTASQAATDQTPPSGTSVPIVTQPSGTDSSDFPFNIRIEEVSIPDFRGLHSFAYAQHDGKWLLVGGRTDGLHARQPFAAFPLANNNHKLIVMDPDTREFWSAPLDPLPTDIREHLQSANTNFYQAGDTLFIMGGYAYSETARGHITFPKLTTIKVSEVIKGVMNGKLDSESFKHFADERFAVTGGQLGKIGDVFYLVSGHRFDGRYTPENTRQNIQVYTNAIQRFSLNITGTSLVIKEYSSIVDQDHLRRRDFNLVPYLFADGRPGYLISTGVFQAIADLPFLTLVEVDKDSYYPVQKFEQYLSHYHSPKLAMYDSSQNSLHMLFFGGLAQFYYKDGTRIQDDNVPFVTTISRVTRNADGTFTEQPLPVSMPDYAGTSAEFIPNTKLNRSETGVFMMGSPASEPILLGYMVGGITSPTANPFSTNQTGQTTADSRIFRIWVEYK